MNFEILKVVSNDSPSNNIFQFVSSLATLLAIVVALFQEKIRKWFNEATIEPTISLSPPDCHQIDLTSKGAYVGKAIYTRLRLTHIKGQSGNNIEVIISKVEKKAQSGKWKIDKYFLPMNLQWSHTHQQTMTIPPNSFRHCDLGSFRQVNLVNQFLVDTIVQPNAVSGGRIPNLLPPGEYRLETLLTGENVKPITSKWLLKFTPSWSNEESIMLNRIILKKI